MNEFNLSFTRDCKQSTSVKANFQLPLDIERPVLEFEWECGKQYAAVLLVAHLNKTLWNRLENIRKEAYETGWKDAKQKKRKRKCFYSTFRPANVGY